MKSTGMIRTIDNLGDMPIPKNLREKFNLISGQQIEFFEENGFIILKPYIGRKEWIEKYCQQCMDEVDNNGKIIIKHIGSTTIISQYSPSCDEINIGIATLSKESEYNCKTGIAVAYAKLIGVTVPNFI